MIKDFGRNNKMVKKLVESMIKSELALDPAEAAQKLNHWSNVICNDYNQKNSLLPSAEDMTLLEIVQQQSVLINQLVLLNRNMEMQLEKQSGELAAVRETVENQSTSMVMALATSLIGALQGVWRGDGEQVGSRELAEPGAWTPSSMTTSNQQNPPEPPLSPSQQVEHSSQNDAVASFIESIQGIIRDAENKGEKGKLVQLSWTQQHGSSVRGMTVKETILVLVHEKRLRAKKKLYDVEPASLNSKNRGHYWACKKLVEQVITEEQRLLLQLDTKEQEKIDDFEDILKITAYTVEHAAFERMKELDGKTTSSMQPTISGLGNRYSKYCEINGVHCIKTSHKNPSAVAPAGNSSITDWFSKAKTRVANVLSPGRSQHQ
jgi:hypothetical protein